MKNKKRKPSVKMALAFTLAVTSTAAIAYATPKIIRNSAEGTGNELILDLKKIDADTVKVSIDNIEDIPRALQFSLKLDGIVLKENNGEPIIKDLINKENSNKIITDYSYNKDKNTIDVLVTSEDSIPKDGNKVDIFELDIEVDSKNESRTYKILPQENSEQKYVSNTNKEYVKNVSVANTELTLNTAPTIERSSNSYIEIKEGEKLQLTKEVLLSNGIVVEDADGDDVTLEVKDVDDKVIQEFTSTQEGVYDLYVTAVDSLGERSETLNIQVKVNAVTEGPTITRNGKELEDITINAGQIFDLMDGITAVDSSGSKVDVEVKSDKNLNLDPDKNTDYVITYTATDSRGRKTVKTITLRVIANKAPIIDGVKDHTLTVGDKFDPRDGVTVIDEDSDIKLVVESNVNTNIAGVYKVTYSATDSGNKTTIKQSIVVVNPKQESINSIPVINASDVVIQLGEEFNPLNGVTATDKEDGPISKIDVVRNEVINDVAGKYKVTYSVTDSKGASATKTITVIVNNSPQINAEDKTIILGEEFNPLSGVTATDKEDGNITEIKVIENNVNTGLEGKYTVTYEVVDNHGGKATKTITVTVKKEVALAESIVINNKINNLYVGSSKILTANVNKEADIKDIEWTTSNENIASIEVLGNDVKVIAKKTGKVTITAKTKDGSNKSDSVTIDILNYEDNVLGFIKEVIDTSVVVPVLGTGELGSPLEMEVQNITVEKMDEFLNKFKKLNPILEEKLEYEEFTVYKIKVEKTSGLAKLFRVFGGSTSDKGYLNIKVANNLENVSSIKAKLEGVLTYEDNSDNSGNTGVEKPSNKPGNTGNAGAENSGNSGNTENEVADNSDNKEIDNSTNSENTKVDSSNNTENKEVIEELDDTKNVGNGNEETEPSTTGKGSIIGYISITIIAVVVAGIALVKKVKIKK